MRRFAARVELARLNTLPPRPELVAIAREVIHAADNAYGPAWRTWVDRRTASGGTRRLAAALVALENELHDPKGTG